MPQMIYPLTKTLYLIFNQGMDSHRSHQLIEKIITTAMAAYDDPNFVKALKLLHSPAPDSAIQLMKLLEDAIEQKHGPAKVASLKLRSWLDDQLSLSYLDIPKHKGSRGPSPVLLTDKSSRSTTPHSEPVSIRTTPDRDDGDLALEIFEDNIFCAICKDITVTSHNRLIECTSCESLYHQECHKPPVENYDTAAWKCSDCTRKSEKQEKHSSSKSKSSSSHESSSKKHKSDSDKSESKSSKREKSSHSKSSSSHSSSSGSKSSSRSESRSSSSKSSSSSLSFSKTPSSPNGKSGSASAPANIMAADKRIQNMKKKAAAKMQEKRSSHK